MIARGYALAGAAVVVAALAGSTALILRQAATLGQHRACALAIAPDARAGADPRKLCDPIIAGRWARAVQAETCDASLSAVPENRYGVGNNCSTAVKRLQAQRDAAATERDGANEALKRERAAQAAAIRRAVADTRVQAERKSRAAAAVQSAPRNPDGLVVCDAGCLRARRASADPGP